MEYLVFQGGRWLVDIFFFSNSVAPAYRWNYNNQCSVSVRDSRDFHILQSVCLVVTSTFRMRRSIGNLQQLLLLSAGRVSINFMKIVSFALFSIYWVYIVHFISFHIHKDPENDYCKLLNIEILSELKVFLKKWNFNSSLIKVS